MDLFVVNRFTGDDVDDVKSEEQNKLSQVLKKINKRQKRKRADTLVKDELQESDLFKSADHNSQLTSEANPESTSPPDADVNDDLDKDEPATKIAKTTNPTNIEGFTILGTDKFDKRPAVKRVLPKWLRNPSVISTDLQKLNEKISRTELNNKLKTRLKENKIKYLFPVQAGFIPWQLRQSKQANFIYPPDVCVSAPTGSGKTLAFAIPVLQHLVDKLERRNMTVKAIRALVVLPTHSLALQVYDAFKSYSSGTGITIGISTSAEITLKNEQKLMVSNNSVWGWTSRSDVLICTAGRLIDHLKSTKGFELQYLEYIIIDEADRVLDSMQDDWLRHLGIHLRSGGKNFVGSNVLSLTSIKKRVDPQKLLFSATLSSDPEKLEKLSLFQPKLFTCVLNKEATNENIERIIEKYTTPEELVEKYATCTAQDKPLVLYKLIMETVQGTESAKIIVFVNDKDTQYRLSSLLCFMAKNAFIVNNISNVTDKKMSKELLKSFSTGKTNVLICSNLLARGLDIPNVDCVISYNAPTHITTYIHRAGRTARAGAKGLCITMLEPFEEREFFGMLKSAQLTRSLEKIHYPINELKSLSAMYRRSLENFKIKVGSEKRHTLFKTKQKKKVFKKYN